MFTVFPAHENVSSAGAASTRSAAADHPVFWFAIMEDAKDRGDFELAARAKEELKRLGVQVAYVSRERKGA